MGAQLLQPRDELPRSLITDLLSLPGLGNVQEMKGEMAMKRGFLGIMGDILEAHLKLVSAIRSCDVRGVAGSH